MVRREPPCPLCAKDSSKAIPSAAPSVGSVPAPTYANQMGVIHLELISYQSIYTHELLKTDLISNWTILTTLLFKHYGNGSSLRNID